MKNIEIRYYLIGAESVGKKSIAKRFEKLSSSETIKGKPIKLEITKEMLRKLGKLHENRNRSNEEIKQIYLEKLKEQSLTNFVKLFTISNLSIEKKVMIVSNPEPIAYNDAKEIVEELDEIERTYKIRFENVKQEIKKLINLTNFNHNKSNDLNTKHVFLFIYDLSDPETLEKIIIYFEQLNKEFDFFNNPDYYPIFIGNKIDIRIPIKMGKNRSETLNNTSLEFGKNNSSSNFGSGLSLLNENKEITHTTQNLIKNLLGSEKSLDFSNPDEIFKLVNRKYPKIFSFEIATKMFFSFENLIEKFFKEIFYDMDEMFKLDYFLEKLYNVLHLRKTFPKAVKKEPENNNFPSPQKYNSDIYIINNEEEKTKAFSSKKRYNYKIFLNKVGPVYKRFKSSNREEYYEKKKSDKQSGEEKISQQSRMRLVEEMNAKKNGFTFAGIDRYNLNLKESRAEIKKSNAIIMSSLTSLSNVSRYIPNERKMKTNPRVIKKYKSPSKERFIENRKMKLEE